MRNLRYTILLVMLQIAPVMVFAQSSVGTPPPGGGGLSYTLNNPLSDYDSLQDFIIAILNVVIVIATPIVVLFIIFAGFQFVTARGEPAKITKAKDALLYAIIGGVLILGAVAIAKIIRDLVDGFGV